MLKNPYFQTEKVETVEYPATEAKGKTLETKQGLTSIIIPAFFNSYPIFHTTGNCIGSIREHTDRAKTPYEIILVQNGHTGIGFTQENAKDSYADKVIFNEQNLGYAKAVNQAIRCSEGEYIAIVNNDVQVFDHWLEDLQACLNAGVDLIQAYPMYGMPYGRAVEANILREKSLTESQLGLDDFRDFSCVLLRKETFAKVGLFDEQFFCYGEDLDLIRRIEQAGGKVKSTKRVRVHHIISMTSSGIAETPDIMNKSKELLKAKWGY